MLAWNRPDWYGYLPGQGWFSVFRSVDRQVEQRLGQQVQIGGLIELGFHEEIPIYPLRTSARRRAAHDAIPCRSADSATNAM